MLKFLCKMGLLTSSLCQLIEWLHGSICIANQTKRLSRSYIHGGLILRKLQQTCLIDTGAPPRSPLGWVLPLGKVPSAKGAALPMVVPPSLWSFCVQWQVGVGIQSTYPLAPFGTFLKGHMCFRACNSIPALLLLCQILLSSSPHCTQKNACMWISVSMSASRRIRFRTIF